eukprot:16619-Heterococcus_DN1.PRE.6
MLKPPFVTDIDQVGITCYNRAYLTKTQQYSQQFDVAFKKAYDQVSIDTIPSVTSHTTQGHHLCVLTDALA